MLQAEGNHSDVSSGAVLTLPPPSMHKRFCESERVHVFFCEATAETSQVGHLDS